MILKTILRLQTFIGWIFLIVDRSSCSTYWDLLSSVA